MYLAQIKVENFRVFGSGDKSLCLPLDSKLTLMVGENDSGKSAVIDAIRCVLGTSDLDFVRLSIEDFHLEIKGSDDGQIVSERVDHLRIECLFKDLSRQEAGVFLEWLGVENIDGTPCYFLRIWLEADRTESRDIDGKITVVLKGGPDEEGIRFDGQARKNLRVTYLRPLRDAEREMSARRGSRLSKILYAHLGPESGMPNEGQELVNIIRDANSKVKSGHAVQEPLRDLRYDYFERLQLSGSETFYPDVTIADPNLRSILEQLQLLLADLNGVDENTEHGLGVNNILFMSAELLLLKSLKEYALPILLIEEPEAHLHPQLQHRLIHFLQDREQDGVQIIMTSHSPNIASSVALKHLVVMKSGQAFPMTPSYTRLDESDYEFLERFLDVTKANLFFARGVLIVEGDAEFILLPTISKLLQRPLDEYGVTIVNVGHTGLFRYARIFQRSDGKDIGVKVACIGDLDIPSDYAAAYSDPPSRTEKDFDIAQRWNDRKARLGEGFTQVFLSPLWTLEHDFCLKPDLAQEMHIAIQTAKSSALDKQNARLKAHSTYDQWLFDGKCADEIAALIYEPLYNKNASKTETAQYFARLLEEKHIELLKSGELPVQDGSIDQASEKYLSYVAGFPDYIVEAIEFVTKPINRPGVGVND